MTRFNPMIANPARDESLLEMLAKLARRSGDGELALATGIGFGGGILVAAILGRPAWVSAAMLLAIGAFGAWGMADRELRERGGGDGRQHEATSPAIAVLRAARFAFGSIGALLCLALVGRLVSMVIGKWGGGM